MLNGRSKNDTKKVRMVVLTADANFEKLARYTFGANAQIDLAVVTGGVVDAGDTLRVGDATVVIVDIDATQQEELQALNRLMQRIGSFPPVVVVTQALNDSVPRKLVQMRVADFLVKPVTPSELVSACARVAQHQSGAELKEAQIYTLLPAAGGVGVTTLAIQTALTLLRSGRRGAAPSTCLIDLNFQHGACADYLDLEPHLNLSEIGARPERLDSQLLQSMLSHHSSGLAVIAAQNRPDAMQPIDPIVVTCLLDLVSSHFDHVVIDMPRTWFSWTDNVLRGSNKLFVVSEMTVPGLQRARQLVATISERLDQRPKPQVIVNRFQRRFFSAGLSLADVKQILGDSFGATVPRNDRLVNEAIDRGISLEEVRQWNSIAVALKKLILARPAAKSKPVKSTLVQKAPKLFWAQ